MISTSITCNNRKPLFVLSQVEIIRTHFAENGITTVGKNKKMYKGANFLSEKMFGTFPGDSHNRTHVLLNSVMCSRHQKRILRGAMHIIDSHVSLAPRALVRNKNSILGRVDVSGTT